MKTLYLELNMGAAGDMLNAALYELLDDPGKASYIDKMNSLGLNGVTVTAKKTSKCGITGTHMEVCIDGMEEAGHDHHHDHDHDHQHDHHHEHHHEHNTMDSISHVIESMPVSADVANNVKNIYAIIADAESRVHSVPVSDIHFHEVGTMDAIADITGFCLLMEMLAFDRVVVSPVCTGFGQVRCAHGILPVPAPATALILEGIPVYAGNIEGELITPTGAALIKYFADDFRRMGALRVDAIGYGMGRKDFEAANCVRAMSGEDESVINDIVELSCNIDDMTGEDIGYALEVLRKEGAKDVYATAISMKRSRPGTMISVLCDPADTEKMVKLLFKHTTTLGIRKSELTRYVLDRKTKSIDTDLGKADIKISTGYGITRIKPEYEHIRQIAEKNDMSIADVRSRIGKYIDESKKD